MQKIIFMIFVSLLFSSCALTRSFDMHLIHEQSKADIVKTEEEKNKLNDQLSSLLVIEKELRQSPKYKKILDNISSQKAYAQLIAKEVDEYKDFFEKHPLSKKISVSPFKKEYKEIKPYEKLLIEKRASIARNMAQFFRNTEDVQNEIKKQKILLIETTSLENKMSEAQSSFFSQISKADSEIDQAYKKISQTRLSDPKKKYYLRKISRMNYELGKINAILKDFVKFNEAVKLEVNKNKTQVLTPEKETYHFQEKIKEYGENIQAHSQTLNKYAREI